MVDRSTPARKLGGLGKREGLEACCMVLALLIRSSLACLASRFSHCTQQGCWFGVFCHQKNSNSAPDLGIENHIPSSPFVVSAISVRAVSGCKRIFLRNPLMLSLPSLVFLPSLCVFSGLTEMDPQWGDANFAEVHSKLYDEIMSSIHLVFAHFSDGVRGLPAERLGQAMRILGMNPTEDQDLWPQIGLLGRIFDEEIAPPCDSLVMFGLLLNCPFAF